MESNMIVLKCPECGREGQAPEKVVDEGHNCFQCGIPMVIASEEIAAERTKEKEKKVFGTAIGACIGMLFVFVVGKIGGPLGMGIVGAIDGALLGLIVGVLKGRIFAIPFASPEQHWLPFAIKVFMVIGSFMGFVGGFAGGLAGKHAEPLALLIACFGGLCIGGLVGLGLAWKVKT